MRIGELAERTGVTAKTIRYWEAEGLVPEPERTPSGYRNYDHSAVERIGFIRQAQTAGLVLSQIRQILDVRDDGTPPCEHVAEAVDRRLAEVEARIDELQATRTQLRHLAARAAVQDPLACKGICSIISEKGARAGIEPRPPTRPLTRDHRPRVDTLPAPAGT